MPKMFCILLLALAGCATSPHKSFDDVRFGVDKDRVLENLGNPQRTYREAMQDHWIYTYFEKDHEWRREVVFEDGKVVKVTHPLAREDWVKELEHTNSMEEFEHKARAHEKRASDFKSIDGQPDDADQK